MQRFENSTNVLNPNLLEGGFVFKNYLFNTKLAVLTETLHCLFTKYNPKFERVSVLAFSVVK